MLLIFVIIGEDDKTIMNITHHKMCAGSVMLKVIISKDKNLILR